MVDIVATSYFGTKYAINETTKMFSSDINNINYVCAGGTDATYEDGRKLTEYVEKLDEVEKSGYFSEGVAQGLDNDLRIPVVIADTKIQQIGNLKLSNKLKEAMQNVPQGYQCMLLGYNYKNKVNIGDIFSASIYKNDKCIVVGFLQKDAMWPKRGRLFDVSTGEDIYTLENSGIIITDNYELYDTSKVADTSYEYYFLVSDYNKDIVYDKIKAFASENSITALIVNIGENIQNKIEENGLSNNKNITATVMFVILATLSMSVSCVVHCMLDKKSYGTMVVCGMKKKEIIKMTVFYNGFLFISSEIIFPSLKRTMRPQYSAISGSCVTRTIVFPICLLRFTKNSITSTLVFVSRLPVGSSASRISGSFTNARAIATRCICPPDI